MKYFLSIFCFCVALTSFSQTTIGKYKLALPDTWRNNRALIKHLQGIAPAAFNKINDMQMCLDCKASYTLMFFCDSFNVESWVPVSIGSSPGGSTAPGRSRNAVSNYECHVVYHFRGSWVLLDKDSIAIAELVLIDPAEQLIKKTRFSIPQYILPDRSIGEKQMRLNPNDNPMQVIEKSKQQFSPTAADILSALEQRVWSLSLK